jgi:fluoride exporter
MIQILPVMLGGAIGAGLRYFVSLFCAARLGEGFPYGTLLVNLIGGFVMGILYAFVLRGQASEPLRLFVGIGILGGFTTFSAFSLDAFAMLQRGDMMMALLYTMASVVGSLLLLAAGFWLVQSVELAR